MKTKILSVFVAIQLLFCAALHAGGLAPDDGGANDYFGWSVSLSGNQAVTGAYANDSSPGFDQGAAYIFRNVDTAGTGYTTEDLRLITSDAANQDQLGVSVAIFGTNAVVGAYGHDSGGTDRGAAYIFRNINTGSGNKTQDLKLTASDGLDGDYLGIAVGISGNLAIAGAQGHLVNKGAAYLYRDIDTATGNKTEDLKLLASDGAANDAFGRYLSLSGTIAIVGAYTHDLSGGFDQGAAYIFRNLDSGSGTKSEDLKLLASDAANQDQFGASVSISGINALVGAYAHDTGGTDRGAAYLFRTVNTGSGNKTQDLKLTASDGTDYDNLGIAVSLSGHTAIVGADGDDIGSNANQGSAYIYRNLDTGSGIRTEDVKVYASDGSSGDSFGRSVALDGDTFVVGSPFGSLTGKAYTGSVSALTTLNDGDAYREIGLISFESRTDWIIGNTTSNNTVKLSAGDTATITAPSKLVRIGVGSFAFSNTLIIDGTLNANQIEVGASENGGNALFVNGVVNAPVNVNFASLLGGTGIVNGTVQLKDSATVSPGNSIGTLTTGSNIWEEHAEFNLEFKTDGTGTAGIEWDFLSILGSLTINATSSGPFILNLFTMSNSTTQGMLSSWDPNVNHTWAGFVQTTGGITGFAIDKFTIDTSNFLNPINGDFTLALNGNNLDLVYTAVPEPGTMALFSLVAIPAVLRRLRSQRQFSQGGANLGHAKKQSEAIPR